jgi:hypothetical protein
VGGSASGRSSRFPTAVASGSLVLRVRDQPTQLKPTEQASITRSCRADSDTFPIQVIVAWPMDSVAHATLRHATRNGEERSISYRVGLEGTACRICLANAILLAQNGDFGAWSLRRILLETTELSSGDPIAEL